MAIIKRLRKWLALSSYKANLPSLLVQRYGRGRRYTPAQVLTTIQRHRLSERYAAYACAMFCSERAYSQFLTKQGATTDWSQASDNDHSLRWAVTNIDWPIHREAVTELRLFSYGDFAPSHFTIGSHSNDHHDVSHHHDSFGYDGGDWHHGGSDGHDGSGGHHGTP